jgi:dTDP-4-amino-4,6-dideoxygalactose transaminase
MWETKPGLLPRSEAILSRHICLPVHARLRAADAAYVVERLLHHTRELTQSANEML